MNPQKTYRTQLIKRKAQELGFDFCGISQAGFLDEEAPRLESWLKKNMHGSMQWMENHFDKRLNPTLLVEGAKSVVSMLLNYYPEEPIQNEHYKISKYAYGKDYHYIIKDKLKKLIDYLKEEIGDVNGRAFVDSAPVMDKAWAKKSGLGWIGKNTNLVNTQTGSFFFLAEIIIDIDLDYDGPIKDYCGTCTRCMDACPTDALSTPYMIDASRCISYLTIELKEQLPKEFEDKMDNWIFGCDICQDVCPWNRFSKSHNEQDLKPSTALKNMKDTDWEEITQEVFKNVFKNSAIKRTKFEGLKRNLEFVKKNKES